ncbi:MAG: PAS domain-containing protein [Bacteroidetes bacterium]|nr:PAS domain-containing protein [Bacteroidota bacterium]
MESSEGNYLMVIDREGNILYANQLLNELLCTTSGITSNNFSINNYLDASGYFTLQQILTTNQPDSPSSFVDLKLKNGSIHNINWQINGLKIDGSSHLKYLCIGKDIEQEISETNAHETEKKNPGIKIKQDKQAVTSVSPGEELKKLNERLHYFSGLTSDAIWEWNTMTGEMFRNKALLNMIGFQPEKVQDLNWWFNRIHPNDRREVQKKIDHVFANKETYWYSDYQFKYADGIYRKVSDKGFVVYENNIPVRMIGSIQNISEISQLEKLLQQEKEMHKIKIAETILEVQEKERNYLGQELHDNVNQILSSAKLYLDQLKLKKAEEKIIIDKVSEFMKTAIGEIRRLSHQLVPTSLRTENLIESIENVIDDVRIINTFNARFTYNNADMIELLCEEKKMALFRIVQEQICNIVKHSNATNIRINLRVEHAGIILYIYDDGLGFDTGKVNYGIGLNNIFARVKLFKGSADLASSPGKGCSLTVLMPLV